MSYIELENVEKEYRGEVKVLAVHDMSFTIEEGEMVAILGQSGAGKTTLLNMLGGMDSPTGGTIKVDGKNISRMKTALKRKGFLLITIMTGIIRNHLIIMLNLMNHTNMKIMSKRMKTAVLSAQAIF